MQAFKIDMGSSQRDMDASQSLGEVGSSDCPKGNQRRGLDSVSERIFGADEFRVIEKMLSDNFWGKHLPSEKSNMYLKEGCILLGSLGKDTTQIVIGLDFYPRNRSFIHT
jgi:hypothetical protein